MKYKFNLYYKYISPKIPCVLRGSPIPGAGSSFSIHVPPLVPQCIDAIQFHCTPTSAQSRESPSAIETQLGVRSADTPVAYYPRCKVSSGAWSGVPKWGGCGTYHSDSVRGGAADGNVRRVGARCHAVHSNAGIKTSTTETRRIGIANYRRGVPYRCPGRIARKLALRDSL
jgi:hypothetical protein